MQKMSFKNAIVDAVGRKAVLDCWYKLPDDRWDRSNLERSPKS